MTCPSCLELYRFPTTLPCNHTVCKPCLLANQTGGVGVNVLCPACRFSCHFEGEDELKVNQAVQIATDVLRGDAVPRVACMRCERTEATVNCESCKARYCSACCDLVHVGRLAAHSLEYSSVAVLGAHVAPTCPQLGHHEYRCDLYCTDCRTLLCVVCSQTTATHRGHNIVPLSEAAAAEEQNVRKVVTSALEFRAELRDICRKLDASVNHVDLRSAEELAVVEQALGSALAAIERKRAELLKRGREIRDAEMKKAQRAKEQILAVASKVNDSVARCQRAMALGNDVDILTSRAEMERQLAGQAPIVLPQLQAPRVHFPQMSALLAAVDASSVFAAAPSASSDTRHHHGGDGNALLPPGSPLIASVAGDAAVVDVSCILKRRGFRFSKSTYGGIRITSSGCVATSQTSTSGGGWETVMGDAVLREGVHYWEVQLTRYDSRDGHNVVVGVVFDGAQDLPEVVGEDEHSVGFDTGCGTKTANGNFFLSYGTACGKGDVVGVKVDYFEGTIEFYRNDRPLGAAFTGLARPCYAAVSMIHDQQVSLMFPSRVPL